MDFELTSEKAVRLEREVEDMSTSRTDAADSLALKRLKTELEGRLKEQEEELDDQAGTIQHLEQVRCKHDIWIPQGVAGGLAEGAGRGAGRLDRHQAGTIQHLGQFRGDFRN